MYRLISILKQTLSRISPHAFLLSRSIRFDAALNFRAFVGLAHRRTRTLLRGTPRNRFLHGNKSLLAIYPYRLNATKNILKRHKYSRETVSTCYLEFASPSTQWFPGSGTKKKFMYSLVRIITCDRPTSRNAGLRTFMWECTRFSIFPDSGFSLL